MQSTQKFLLTSACLLAIFSLTVEAGSIRVRRNTPNNDLANERIDNHKKGRKALNLVDPEGAFDIEQADSTDPTNSGVNTRLARIEQEVDAAGSSQMHTIVKDHGVHIHKLQNTQMEQGAQIKHNHEKTEILTTRANDMERDFGEEKEATFNNFAKANERIDNHQTAIRAANGAIRVLNDGQEEQGKQIEAIDTREKANFVATTNRLNGHAAEHKEHRLQFGKIDTRFDEQGRLIGDNATNIKNLNDDHEKTKATVKTHGDELIKTNAVVTQNVNDISDLNRKHQTHEKNFNEHTHAYGEYTKANDAKHQNIDIQFGTVNDALKGLHATTGEHGRRLDTQGKEIKSLRTDLGTETSERTKAHGELKEQQDAHTVLLGEHGGELKKHGLKQTELEGSIGNVDTKVDGFRADYDAQNLQNAKQFGEHGAGIAANKNDISGLQTLTKTQGESIQKAHGDIALVNGRVDATNVRVDDQGKIITVHDEKLGQNADEFSRVHEELKGHGGRLVKAESENEARITDIKGVQANLETESGKIHKSIGETNAHVAANRAQIDINTDTIGKHGARITDAESVQTKHEGHLQQHDKLHDEHGIAFKDINGRFRQQEAEVKVLLSGQKEINTAMMDAEKTLAEEVLGGQKEMADATAHAVKNVERAVKVIEEKMNVIEQAQKAQLELIQTHIIKEATIQLQTPEQFIQQKIEETAVAAAEEVQARQEEQQNGE